MIYNHIMDQTMMWFFDLTCIQHSSEKLQAKGIAAPHDVIKYITMEEQKK